MPVGIKLTLYAALLLCGFCISTECQTSCAAPKAHKECASACSSTCDDPSPICTAVCVPRCVCPSELYERSRSDASCVLPSSCPGAGCSNNVTMVNCLVAPCSNSSCSAFPSAVCFDEYCGACKARYFYDGKEVTAKCSVPVFFALATKLLVALGVVVSCCFSIQGLIW